MTTKTRKKRMGKGMIWAHKRPWRVTYRNKNGEKTTKILKNGTKKNKLLKQIHKEKLYVYGINNLTDHQIAYYTRNGLL
jgi:hypothetical protein